MEFLQSWDCSINDTSQPFISMVTYILTTYKLLEHKYGNIFSHGNITYKPITQLMSPNTDYQPNCTNNIMKTLDT